MPPLPASIDPHLCPCRATRNGRPQQSNVCHAVGNDGLIRISVTADRAKAKNAARDPRVSPCVSAADGWSDAMVEGSAALSPVAVDPSDATVDGLVELYRAIQER